MNGTSPDYHALASEWFRKATEDFETAMLVYDERTYPSVACFHAHQAAEKLLKGLLVWHGKDILDEFKTHNLLKLLEYARGAVPTLPEQLREDCLTLNRYYVWARYPSDAEEYGWDEVREANDAAGRIRQAISTAVGQGD